MMSRLLGLGENQYGLYEKGEMPALSVGRLLSLVGNRNFIIYCAKNSPLSEKEKSKVLKSVGHSSDKERSNYSIMSII